MSTLLLKDAIRRRPTVAAKDREQVRQKLMEWDFGYPKSDPGCTFVEKLALQEGWHLDYTRRVEKECHRFIALRLYYPQARHVPSRVVDACWHLAITYSERYVKMGRHFLGGYIHHIPSSTVAQKAQLRQTYEQTLQHYEEVFGEQPPTDIWPGLQQDPQAYGEECCDMLDPGDCEDADWDIHGHPEPDDDDE